MKKPVYILLILLCCSAPLKAQQVVHKVSKTITREVSKVHEFILTGEKADIVIEGWDKPGVHIEAVLISRNTLKDKAIAEIENIKVEFVQDDAKFWVKNYFSGKSSNITGNLSVEYRIKIPKDINVSVSNLYGKTQVNKLNNKLSVSVAFGSLQLHEIMGEINIHNRYSNIEGSGISGTLVCQSEKSDILLKEVASKISIKASYGKIDLSISNKPKPVEIDGSRCEVRLTLRDKKVNLRLNNLESTIRIFDGIESTSGKYQSMVYPAANEIIVSTTYCPITISYEEP